MYVQGVQTVTNGVLPNTGDGWLMMAAGVVTLVAGVALVATTTIFMVAKKKAHKA